MMFVYLFGTALVSAAAAWIARGVDNKMVNAALRQQAHDQLAKILELKRTVERLEEIAAGRERV